MQTNGIGSLVNLPFVHSVRDRHGRTRHYFRRTGFKSVRLPGLPGSAEFNRAYEAAKAGETAPRIEIGATRNKPGSVAAAVALYLGSMAFGNLAPGTQRDRRRVLEHFREAHGDDRFALLERKHVDAMLLEKSATPHAARHFLNALHAMAVVAITAGLRDDDPTHGVRVKARDTGGFRTWNEEEIAQFEAAHSIGTRARLAFALLLFTAQRRGDVIRMGRQHVRDGFIAVRQQKTGTSLQIPVHPDLQEILAAHSAANLTFLATEAGAPFAANGFTHWFRKMCVKADLPMGLSAHGLRKAACRRLAEAGCSANQIAAISGHATLHEVSRYTKAADQKRLAADAMRAIATKPKPGTASGKPAVASGKHSSQAVEKKR
jgi:integrase